MKNLVIIGAGDLGREILYASQEALLPLNDGEGYKVLAFVDEDESKIGNSLEGIEIIGLTDIGNTKYRNANFILGVGNAFDRIQVFNRLLEMIPSPNFINIIHKSVTMMPNCKIGNGNFLAPNSTIAIGVELGDHAVINQNSSIGHDCYIGDFSVVSPGCILSGHTNIGFGCFLGSGVVTYPNVNIGEKCVVSALTPIPRSIKAGCKLISKPNTMLLKD